MRMARSMAPLEQAQPWRIARLVDELLFGRMRSGISALSKPAPAGVCCPALIHARVAELADALDLGSSAFGRAGSIPVSRIRQKTKDLGRLRRLARVGFFFGSVLILS